MGGRGSGRPWDPSRRFLGEFERLDLARLRKTGEALPAETMVIPCAFGKPRLFLKCPGDGCGRPCLVLWQITDQQRFCWRCARKLSLCYQTEWDSPLDSTIRRIVRLQAMLKRGKKPAPVRTGSYAEQLLIATGRLKPRPEPIDLSVEGLFKKLAEVPEKRPKMTWARYATIRAALEEAQREFARLFLEATGKG